MRVGLTDAVVMATVFVEKLLITFCIVINDCVLLKYILPHYSWNESCID